MKIKLSCEVVEINGRDYLKCSIFNPENAAIKDVTHRLLDMEDKQMRKYLISKGWTPPKEAATSAFEKRLKDALIDMVRQYLPYGIDSDIYSHQFMSAGENALELLTELKVMETMDDVCYMFKKETNDENV